MNKSTFLIAAAIAAAFTAGFLLGRTQSAPPAQPVATSAGNEAPDTASAPTTPARGFDPGQAATLPNTDPPAMPESDDAQRPPPPRPASPTENRLLGVRGLRVDDENNVVMNPRFAQIIDALSRYKELGVTVSSVPIPPMANAEAYLEYAQWVIEEIKPHL